MAQHKRDGYWESLAKAKALEGNSTKAKQLKAIKHREDIRLQFRSIRHVCKKMKKTAVIMVEKLNETGEIETLTNKEEMEEECRRSCKARLLQTRSTPFHQPPLNTEFMGFEDTPAVQQVLQGTYEAPAGTDPYAKLLLKYFKTPAASLANEPVKITWTTEEYIDSWKCKKERTSSGDSAFHFGHYKALTRSKYLAQVPTLTANIVANTGYSLKRWQRTLDVMIPKKINSYIADEMRLLNLMEPCFNHYNGLLARRFMARAEKHQLIAKEQFGSRKNHSAIIHATNKVLTFDYMRALRRPGIICANDAKGCYDRIILVVAFLALRRLGLPATAIQCMFATTQNMKHYTRTAFGTSEDYYGGDKWDVSPDGALQGQQFAPGMWAGVSSPILEMMDGEGFGMQFIAPITNLIANICGFAFVDDTDLAQLGSHNDTRDSLLKKMQDSVNLWEGGIRTTGGAIVPRKSDWVLIDFEWTGSNWKYGKFNRRLKLTSLRADGEREALKQLHIHTGRLTLGVHIAGDGNWKDEKKYLLGKSKEWAHNLKVGHLDRASAWIAFQTSITQSLSYCHPASYINEKDWNDIYSPARSMGIAKSGIVRNLDKSICYGSVKFQGLGLKNPFHSQGIAHIKVLMDHGGESTITGIILTSLIELMKYEIGIIDRDLFSCNWNKFQVLATYGWLHSTWEFLWKFNIYIKETTSTLPLLRENDRCIMEDIMNNNNLTTDIQQAANRVRKHLKITRLSELYTSSGSHIRRDIYNGRNIPHLFQDIHLYAATGTPTPSDISKWQNALRQTYNFNNIHHQVRSHLGSWTTSTDNKWIWFYSEDENRIFKSTSTQFNDFQVFTPLRVQNRSRRRHINYPFIHTSTVPSLPDDYAIATVYFKPRSNQYFLQSYSTTTSNFNNNLEIPQAPLLHTPLTTAALSIVDSSLHWILTYITWPHDGGAILASDIHKNKTIAISDGSYKDSLCTAAFVIHSHTPGASIIGVLPGHGQPDIHNAYRGELTGLLGIAIALQVIVKVHDIRSGIIRMGCDNDTAMNKCLEPTWKPNCGWEHLDIIKCTRHILSLLSIDICKQYVDGHKDKKCSFDKLNLPEQLNVQCDSLSKLIWKDLHTSGYSPPTTPLPYTGWLPMLEGLPVVTKMDDTLHEHCSAPGILKTWRTRRLLTPNTVTKIAWNATKKAMNSVPLSRKLYVVKQVARRDATGVEMLRRKERNKDHCPRCLEPHEDHAHIIHCQQDSAISKWRLSIDKLQLYLDKIHTPEDLSTAICQQLLLWQGEPQRDHNWERITSINADQFIAAQKAVGWTLILEGCIPKIWIDMLQDYFKSIDKEYTGLRWATLLIKKLWETSWDMWDHRNRVLNDDEGDEDLLGITSLHEEIIETFNTPRPYFLPQDDIALFTPTLAELLSRTVQMKKAWLEKAKAAISLSEHRHFSFMTQERTLIRNWLQQNNNDDG